MSRTRKHNDKYQRDDEPQSRRSRQRRLSARGVRRTDPDLARMGKALIAFALAEAESEAADPRDRRTAQSDAPKRLGGKESSE